MKIYLLISDTDDYHGGVKVFRAYEDKEVAEAKAKAHREKDKGRCRECGNSIGWYVLETLLTPKLPK